MLDPPEPEAVPTPPAMQISPNDTERQHVRSVELLEVCVADVREALHIQLEGHVQSRDELIHVGAVPPPNAPAMSESRSGRYSKVKFSVEIR